MDKKIIITAIVAVALVIVVAGVYGITNNGHDSQDVTYNGNGGTYEGENTFVVSNETVIPNVFTNSGYTFSEWNTKADGNGETYAVGEEISYGTVLYAQWVHTVTSYSASMGNFTPLFQINGEELGLGSYLGSTSVITISGGSGWTYDSALDLFYCTYEGTEYMTQVEITGAESIVSAVVGGVPTITMATPDNIGVSISVLPVY
jgi:hypothetical protein